MVLLRKLGDEIGVRHSFYFKEIEFGYSDIDFTIYNKNKISFNEYSEIRKRLKLSKALIPIMGEINCYEGEGINKLERLINPFEALRDPLLKKNCTVSDTKNEAQKIIFILRIIESDKYNLKNKMNKRFKKLSYTFSLIESKKILLKKDIESLKTFNNYIQENFIETESELITNYLNATLSESAMTNLKLRELLSCLNINWDEFSKLKEKRELSDDLIVEIIKWELWGIYSQMPFIDDYSVSLTHVLVLGDVLKSITSSYDNELDYLIERLNEQL